MSSPRFFLFFFVFHFYEKVLFIINNFKNSIIDEFITFSRIKYSTILHINSLLVFENFKIMEFNPFKFYKKCLTISLIHLLPLHIFSFFTLILLEFRTYKMWLLTVYLWVLLFPLHEWTNTLHVMQFCKVPHAIKCDIMECISSTWSGNSYSQNCFIHIHSW